MFLARSIIGASRNFAHSTLRTKALCDLVLENCRTSSSRPYNNFKSYTTTKYAVPRSRSSIILCNASLVFRPGGHSNSFSTSSSSNLAKYFSSSSDDGKRKKTVRKTEYIDEEAEKKLGLLQRYKLLFKRYGYVCFPVHFAIMPFWYGSFFLAAKAGVDIMPVLHYTGVVPLIESISPALMDKLQNGDAGHHLVALAMYKLASPVRYMLTLGASTYVIDYLKFHGYIKPMTKKNMKGMYDDKKEELKDIKEDVQKIYEDKKGDLEESKKQLQGMYKQRRDRLSVSRVRLQRIYEKKGKAMYDETKGEIQEMYEDKRGKLEKSKKQLQGLYEQRKEKSRKDVNKIRLDFKKRVLGNIRNGKNGKNGNKR